MAAALARRSVGSMHALLVTGRIADDAAAYRELGRELAPALDAIPGLVSRTVLENRDTGHQGGFYLFEDRAAFDRFVASELYAVLHGGEVAASEFSVAEAARR
jgi:hypothetical protein